MLMWSLRQVIDHEHIRTTMKKGVKSAVKMTRPFWHVQELEKQQVADL